MTRITKLELTQINARLASENETLRKQVGDLLMDLEMERAVARHEQRPVPAPRPQYQMPTWQQERARAMAAAKAMAMNSGRAVKV